MNLYAEIIVLVHDMRDHKTTYPTNKDFLERVLKIIISPLHMHSSNFECGKDEKLGGYYFRIFKCRKERFLLDTFKEIAEQFRAIEKQFPCFVFARPKIDLIV